MRWRIEIISDGKCQSSHVGDGDISARVKNTKGIHVFVEHGTQAMNFGIFKKQ